jgi:SNF2 family DNA or RNA helicase
VEQTWYIEQTGKEKAKYEELVRYYRNRVLERQRSGLGPGGASGSTRGGSEGGHRAAEALGALLRLRQAACHPGLLDPDRRDESSAKVDFLLEKLGELKDEGHKVLVFSQFTKLLDLLRPKLKQAGITFETLDGRTRHREAHVKRFQEDPEVTVFLISLKAGGVGLNLVAADYVFILDPWWNPAAEAQAIDRAHRLGQTKKVIAYRLLTRGTVEEKVEKLQAGKRELAEALFADQRAFAAKLDRDVLEGLLTE